jgi:uncharacterized short protein YbdD (DUF466 family)
MTATEAARAAHSWLERAAYVVRRVIGVPDYDRYVAHVHAHHPGMAPMVREEFIRQRMADRYNKPGSRCC